ncbi:MAG: hypothetical protein C0P72_010180, partial [Clostridia bacterium]
TTHSHCTTRYDGETRGLKVMDFNQIMTNRINEKIEQQVNEDFAILKEAFKRFIKKYDNPHIPFYKLKEHTIKSLESSFDRFIMFPELQEELFKEEANRLIGKLWGGSGT